MEELVSQLVREVRERYFGKYRGLVVDNRDPEGLGRLRLRVPSVLAEATTGWALPCLPFGGLPDQGVFSVPEVGAQVWVEFEEGDLSHPIWVGTFWQQSGDPPAVPEREAPTARLLHTAAGHRLTLDDEPGEERLVVEHPSGARLEVDPAGTIALTDAAGARLTLDAEASELRVEDANGNALRLSSEGSEVADLHGNRVATSAAGVEVASAAVVKIEGAQVALGGTGGEPLIKGASFLGLFATHIHPTTGIGSPTGPPLPQGEMSTLTTKVTGQ